MTLSLAPLVVLVFVIGLFLAGVFAALTAVAWSAASMITFRILSASAGSACGPSAMAVSTPGSPITTRRTALPRTTMRRTGSVAGSVSLA